MGTERKRTRLPEAAKYTPEYCNELLRLEPAGCDRIFMQVQRDLDILAKKRRPRRRKSLPAEAEMV
jgi:hypothetical protein